MLKLYTKTGDTGKSSILSGKRIPKDHPIFEVLGTLDELGSALGIVATKTQKPQTKQILQIQDTLLTIGALVAGSQKVKLTPKHLKFLETKIDYYQKHTIEDWYKNFLLPGGIEAAAHTDLSRSICRRLERSLISLESSPDFFDFRISNFEFLKAYVNRLSDFLFALRCYLNSQANYKEIKFKSDS